MTEREDRDRLKLDGAEFENVVLEILTELGKSLPGFRVEHEELIDASDGQYRIDLTVRFFYLGVKFLVLVECKNHVRPVEREDVQVLADRLRATGAQKGILFSTNGFQRGALQYARSHGVALVRIIDGALTYETRRLSSSVDRLAPPPWAEIPPYVGQLVIDTGEQRRTVISVDRRDTRALLAALLS